jgi:photosystem II stability/assembly factor-like uncharacterized protein
MNKIIQFCVLLILIILIQFNNSANAQHWVLAGTIPSPGLTPSISTVDANTAWIAGGTENSPMVYRTINGGINWEAIPTQGTTTELQCIWAVNSNIAFVGEGVVNSFARLYKIASDGKSWINILETGQNDGAFNNLIFSRNNPLIGGALADEIYITTNGGNNWVLKLTGVVGVSSAQNSLMLIDDNFFGFGLKNGAARVRMTTNSGGIWSTKNINLSGTYTSGFTFKDDKLIGISSTSLSMPNISRTTDGGNTWTVIDIGAGLSGNTVIKWVPSTNVVYIIGANGAVKRSINNGLTWTSMETANVTGLNHFDFNKVNNIICGYAVSSNGSVIKLADSVLILTNAGSNSIEVPSEYKLHQNYPNPFNPVTKINFDLPGKSNVKLTVYDIAGKEIAILINESFNAGTHEYTFNAGKFSSGVYLYKIETGNFSDTKRMVLIK